MKNKRDITIILAVAFFSSLMGFILDLKEYYPDFKQNIFDIALMTGIFFVIGILIYSLLLLIIKIIPKK